MQSRALTVRAAASTLAFHIDGPTLQFDDSYKRRVFDAFSQATRLFTFELEHCPKLSTRDKRAGGNFVPEGIDSTRDMHPRI